MISAETMFFVDLASGEAIVAIVPPHTDAGMSDAGSNDGRHDRVVHRFDNQWIRSVTVRELSDFCRYNRDALPLLIRIPSNGPSAASKIQFSAQTLTLREFIREVKNHTKCQPDFVGCGNAYSILYGPTYNFGLKFVPRRESGYRW
jgi:hypothetical protein